MRAEFEQQTEWQFTEIAEFDLALAHLRVPGVSDRPAGARGARPRPRPPGGRPAGIAAHLAQQPRSNTGASSGTGTSARTSRRAPRARRRRSPAELQARLRADRVGAVVLPGRDGEVPAVDQRLVQRDDARGRGGHAHAGDLGLAVGGAQAPTQRRARRAARVQVRQSGTRCAASADRPPAGRIFSAACRNAAVRPSRWSRRAATEVPAHGVGPVSWSSARWRPLAPPRRSAGRDRESSSYRYDPTASRDSSLAPTRHRPRPARSARCPRSGTPPAPTGRPARRRPPIRRPNTTSSPMAAVATREQVPPGPAASAARKRSSTISADAGHRVSPSGQAGSGRRSAGAALR